MTEKPNDDLGQVTVEGMWTLACTLDDALKARGATLQERLEIGVSAVASVAGALFGTMRLQLGIPEEEDVAIMKLRRIFFQAVLDAERGHVAENQAANANKPEAPAVAEIEPGPPNPKSPWRP